MLLAVLGMGGVTAWNLRNGFSDYLLARDVQRLEKFAMFVQTRAQQAGSLQALQAQGVDMRRLLDAFALQEGVRPRPSEPPPGSSRDAQGRPPPPFPQGGLGERMAIVHPEGTPLWGRTPLGELAPIDRPIQIDGVVVAMARMAMLAPVPDAVDAQFLRTQYLGIIGVAAALLVLVLCSAWWVASRWVTPLLAIQEATRRIAQGEFGCRLHEARSDEIGDVMRNVNAMAQALGQLEGARRRWVADISHELRTPLTVLRGELEALVDGIRPRSPNAIVSLRDEVLSLAALVDDLHLLAMSDLNALPCHFEDADAVALVRRVIQRFELRANQARLSLTLSVAPDLRVPVYWDPRRIEQLLGNLLDNSLRYTDAPGNIVVSLTLLAREVAMDVDDSSPGVAPADLARLFEPLFRADVARSRHRGGSGLGLSICRAIVQAHRGQLQAMPSLLGGVRIRMLIPLDLQEPP